MTSFETKTCSRCGGSGQHSYCQMWGTVCFKCHGRKVVYTKRGAAARAWYEERLSKPAGTLTVGQSVWVEPGPLNRGGFTPILAIEPDTTEYNGQVDPNSITLRTKHLAWSTGKDSLVRVSHTAEEKAPIKAAALEYQALLTKSGELRKLRSLAIPPPESWPVDKPMR